MPFFEMIKINLRKYRVVLFSGLKFEEESDHMNSLIFNKRLESM